MNEDRPDRRNPDGPRPEPQPIRCEECGAMLPDAAALMAHVEAAHVRGNH